MLSIRNLTRQARPETCCVRLLFTSPQSNVYEIVNAKQTPTSGVAITSRVKKLNFPPFVKDLFCGKFNKSMLSYAEVLNYERHRILEAKIKQISDYLDGRKTPILDTEGQISPEVQMWCKTEGLHGLLGQPGFGGKDLLITEVARIHEEVGRDISLSDYLYCSDVLGYRALLEYGSAKLQDKYLSELSDGTSLATLCLHEDGAGSDPNSIQMFARFNPDMDSYMLSGTKTWVANAYTSNLFIVFVNTKSKNYMGEEEMGLTALLVDREDGGVSVKKRYDVSGYSGMNFADVEFNNCKGKIFRILEISGCIKATFLVSKYQVLGTPGDGGLILQSLQNQNKFLMAAGLITNLK